MMTMMMMILINCGVRLFVHLFFVAEEMSTDQNAEMIWIGSIFLPYFLKCVEKHSTTTPEKIDNDNFPAKVRQEVNSPFQHVCGRLLLVLCTITAWQRLNEEALPSRG